MCYLSLSNVIISQHNAKKAKTCKQEIWIYNVPNTQCFFRDEWCTKPSFQNHSICLWKHVPQSTVYIYSVIRSALILLAIIGPARANKSILYMTAAVFGSQDTAPHCLHWPASPDWCCCWLMVLLIAGCGWWWLSNSSAWWLVLGGLLTDDCWHRLPWRLGTGATKWLKSLCNNPSWAD